jgi:hypothetical protein
MMAVVVDAVHGAGVPAALRSGLGRVRGRIRYVAAAYALNLLLAGILGAILMGGIRDSLGSSLAGDRMRSGFDSLWYNSFSSQATGVAATFRPSVTGIGAVFDALDSFLEGFDSLFSRGVGTGIVPVAALYWIASVFLSGGFLAMFAAPAERRSFAADACRWLPGIASIAACALVFYSIVLGVARPWLDDLVAFRTRDVIDERFRFAAILVEYGAVWSVVWLGNMLFDYAKVALIARGRGTIGAPFDAMRAASAVIWRRPVATVGLYGSLGLVWIAGVLLYWAVVPGAAQSSMPAILGTFALGQMFVISRIWTRCLFYASETALYAAIDATPAVAR